MELASALTRWLRGLPPAQQSGLAAFLSQQRDAKKAALPGAPTYGHRQLVDQLPAHIIGRSGRRRVCAAYRVSCVRGARPMRASLSLASGEGGLGLGHPLPSADGHPVWRLRPIDFCKPPPPELGRLPRRVGRGGRVPGPEECFCPTNSLLPRFRDPLGFGRRVPANSLPGVPRLIRTWSDCTNESFITYQCSELPLLPPRLPPSTPAAVAEAALRGGVDVYVATSDHSGHGLFALLERARNQLHHAEPSHPRPSPTTTPTPSPAPDQVLNQLHHARQLGMEPFVFLGAYSFMEPQARGRDRDRDRDSDRDSDRDRDRGGALRLPGRLLLPPLSPQACEYSRSTYHSPPHGDNAWQYWSVQPGA